MASSNKYSRYYTHIKPVIENKMVRSFAPYIFSLIAIAVFTFFAVRPTISTILNLQKSIEENKKVLETLTTKSQNLAEGKNNYDNLSSETKQKISSLLPASPNVTSLIKGLQNSSTQEASAASLQIQPVVIIDDTVPTQVLHSKTDTLTFSYNIPGAYNQFLSVLESLNEASRLLSITNVNLSKSAEGSMVLSVSGKAYYLK